MNLFKRSSGLRMVYDLRVLRFVRVLIAAPIATKIVQRRECEGRQLVGCIQSRYFLADLRDAFFMLAFFFSVVRFLEATFLATFFFVRELGFFAPIAVATLFQTAPGAAVAVVAAAWASSPTKVLVPSAAVFPAATTVFCALAALSRTAGTAVAVASEATLATSPARALARLAALFPAATTVFCALAALSRTAGTALAVASEAALATSPARASAQ
jgi:hypothetical protein